MSWVTIIWSMVGVSYADGDAFDGLVQEAQGVGQSALCPVLATTSAGRAGVVTIRRIAANGGFLFQSHCPVIGVQPDRTPHGWRR